MDTKPNGRPRIYSWNGSDYIDPEPNGFMDDRKFYGMNMKNVLTVNDNDYDGS